VWYLLDRISYWSLNQMSGFVFSRPSAQELYRRLDVYRNALLTSDAYAKLPQDAQSMKQLSSGVPATLESVDLGGLTTMCADRNLGYIVTARRLTLTAMPPVAPYPDHPNRRFYIYDCKDFRGS